LDQKKRAVRPHTIKIRTRQPFPRGKRLRNAGQIAGEKGGVSDRISEREKKHDCGIKNLCREKIARLALEKKALKSLEWETKTSLSGFQKRVRLGVGGACPAKVLEPERKKAWRKKAVGGTTKSRSAGKSW